MGCASPKILGKTRGKRGKPRSWPFTPSPLQCGAEYRAALAAEESLNNERQGEWVNDGLGWGTMVSECCR